MNIEQSVIELRGLNFFAYHGVFPEERERGNTFVVDLSLEANIARAIYTDELDDTVNYALVYEVVQREMSVPSLLLEHVCGRIAAALLDEFVALQRVSVCVAKKNPPIEGAGTCESAVHLVASR
jgi:dihydroneopterin aldolase